MLVVVTLVDGMPVPVVDEIDMVAVGYGLVAAAGLVNVFVFSVRYVRERMLIVVTLMGRMRVTIVHVVGMSVMPDAGVPALRTVLVRVLGMNSVRCGSHRSPVSVDNV
jgi:hypothetical protein